MTIVTGPTRGGRSLVIRKQVKKPAKASPKGSQASAAVRTAVIRTMDGKLSLPLPYAPRVTSESDQGQSWVTLARPARAPILSSSGRQLPKISFDVLLTDKDSTETSQEAAKGKLRAIANSASPTLFNYGPSENAGPWRITSLSFNNTMRNTHNDISQTIATVELTQDSDLSFGVGPASGGVKKTTSKAKAPKKGKGTGSPAPRTVRIKAGQTLTSLAIEFYNDASMWRRIASANNIRNVNNIPAGTLLKIP